DWEKMIEYASTAWTLEPGDVIATGTCSGVAAGMTPPRGLKGGEVGRVGVGGIGYLGNRGGPEPAGAVGFIGWGRVGRHLALNREQPTEGPRLRRVPAGRGSQSAGYA